MSGKLSLMAADVVLVFAAIIGSFGVISAKLVDYRLTLSGVLGITIGCLLVSYWIKPQSITASVDGLIPEKGSPAWPEYEAREHLKNPRQITLHDLFLTDFEGAQKIGGHWAMFKSDKTVAISIEQYVVVNLETNTKQIEIYIPYYQDTYGICVTVANNFEKALVQANEVDMSQQPWGGSAVHSSREAVFSQMIFIYHESQMGPEQIGDLTKLFKGRGVYADFRGESYLSARKLQLQTDLKS